MGCDGGVCLRIYGLIVSCKKSREENFIASAVQHQVLGGSWSDHFVERFWSGGLSLLPVVLCIARCGHSSLATQSGHTDGRVLLSYQGDSVRHTQEDRREQISQL